ncbi:hypothetical protein NKDENANG_01619 [Candidatus Entotheonellaceae bacterium PAL068K]
MTHHLKRDLIVSAAEALEPGLVHEVVPACRGAV